MHVHPRHPYAGKLVFTAFSGSHQDAINKGITAMKERDQQYWEVPYLPIDPSDVGREYEPIVRINSQSGKGGVAFVMDAYYGFKLPKSMHKEFADVIQKIAEAQGEVAPETIFAKFKEQYINAKSPYHFISCRIADVEDDDTHCILTFEKNGEKKTLEGIGNGPIDAVKNIMKAELDMDICVADYSEHALTAGSHAQAAAYIYMWDKDSDRKTYGVGISSNITRASFRAMFSAINRLVKMNNNKNGEIK